MSEDADYWRPLSARSSERLASVLWEILAAAAAGNPGIEADPAGDGAEPVGRPCSPGNAADHSDQQIERGTDASGAQHSSVTGPLELV